MAQIAVREHWREPKYWLWLWRWRVPKLVTLGVIVLGLLAAGLAAAGVTSGGKGSNALVLQTTIKKLVTVEERGRIVRKLVPVAVKKPEAGQRRETVYRVEPNMSPR